MKRLDTSTLTPRITATASEMNTLDWTQKSNEELEAAEIHYLQHRLKCAKLIAKIREYDPEFKFWAK